jgi:hypothetical protein
LTQGAPLPNITTTQQQATTLPQFYQDYLSKLTTQGGTALQGMSFAGPTANQTAAFTGVQNAANAYQPGLTAAGQTATNALGIDAARGASPYITQATGAGTNPLDQLNPYARAATATTGLQQANPYLQSAAQSSAGDISQYMNPYTQNVTDAIARQNKQNIADTLSPQITAGAVGSGQFGSQRGAQALAMGISAADQAALAQQSLVQQAGYNSALQASQQQKANQLAAGQTAGNLSQQQNSLLANIGTSAGSLQQGQNASLLNAAQIQGNLLNTGQQNQLAGAQLQGSLSNQAQANALTGVNAQATIGAQQQAINQAQNNYPITALQQYGSLMQGQTIPTATSSTYTGPIPGAYQTSPLSTALGVASTGAGILDQLKNSGLTAEDLKKFLGIP